MLRIQKLKQPKKLSGFMLAPGRTTKICKLTITNNNEFEVYIDRFSRKDWKRPSRKKKVKLAPEAKPVKGPIES